MQVSMSGQSPAGIATLLTVQPIHSLSTNMGERRTYRLEPPLAIPDGQLSHVMISAMAFDHKLQKPNETMVFPSSESGKMSFSPIEGGMFVGLYSHEKALRKLGYKIGVDANVHA